MKPVYFLLCLTVFLCSVLSSTAQKNEKVCLSPLITFKHFQKGSLNLSVGGSLAWSSTRKGNVFNYGGLVGLAYFPKSYLEVGFRLKPQRLDYKTLDSENVLEKNVYVRYHPLLAICRKTAFFVGMTAYQDGASYSPKESPIANSQIYGGGSFGLSVVPKPFMQLELANEVFFGRSLRHSLSLVLNLKNFKKHLE